ncbi:MAG: ABC transporter ATP-binding protein [Muribaculaceae bacterium]|nr:ABC transporter ATP-binding protein [Muribaculaceae bacterium]
MLQLKGFTAGYTGRTLIDPVDLDFPSSRLTALIGRNGTGKSTLLRAIAGLNEKYSGEILISGKEISAQTSEEKSRLLAFVNTERPRIADMTCRDVVGIGRAPYTDWIGRLTENDDKIVGLALDQVGMSGYADRRLATLSDGECQRVMIARALAQDTPVVLLDEPTSFLDMPSRYELVALLRNLARESGKTILFSTHELDIALQRSDRIVLLADCRLRMLDPVVDPEAAAAEIEDAFGMSL